jgi:hypothetical protein
MPEITAPPKWILFLLWPFKGESCYPQIEGDLREEFHQRESEHGRTAARRWYCSEVCRNLWSLTWRWATIAVIVLPLFFVALGYSTPIPYMFVLVPLVPVLNPLVNALLAAPGLAMRDIMFGMIFLLPPAIIPGLALPVVCGALLRGHDRMIRLVFTAYCLGLSVIYGINHFDNLIRTLGVGIPGILSHNIVLGLLRPVHILPFIWMSSIWVERHRCRKATGGCSSPA